MELKQFSHRELKAINNGLPEYQTGKYGTEVNSIINRINNLGGKRQSLDDFRKESR
jgi:hypothetical protein